MITNTTVTINGNQDLKIKYEDIHFSVRQVDTAEHTGTNGPIVDITTENRKRITYLVIHVMYSDSQGYSGVVNADLQKLAEISINPGDQLIYTDLILEKYKYEDLKNLDTFLEEVIKPMIAEDIKSKMLAAAEKHHIQTVLNKYKSMDLSFQG